MMINVYISGPNLLKLRPYHTLKDIYDPQLLNNFIISFLGPLCPHSFFPLSRVFDLQSDLIYSLENSSSKLQNLQLVDCWDCTVATSK